jgi:hypothetical protein
MGTFTKSLEQSLSQAELPERLTAAVELARKYASLLDEFDGTEGEDEQFSKLGPKYLQALSAIGLVTALRQTTGQKGASNVIGGPEDELAKLRSKRGAASREHTS